MKTFVKKTAAAAVLVLFALFIVTCDVLEPPESGGSGSEPRYTDWLFQANPDGSGTLTVQLDGAKIYPEPPPVPEDRALSINLAKMAHDYFEVIFVNGDIGTLDANGNVTSGGTVARAVWEIGEDAGIRGVARGLDYAAVVPASNGPAAIILVGKKSSKTLLGVGHLFQVDRGATTTVLQNSTSVTFAVHPLTTAIGWDAPATAGGNEVFRTAETFITATGGYSFPGPGTPSSGSTVGGTTNVGRGISVPLFNLPTPAIVAPATTQNVAAVYKIGGLDLDAGTTPPRPDLYLGLFVYQAMETMKRVPSYIANGQRYDATGTSIDMHTDVSTSSNSGADGVVSLTFNIVFTQTAQSTGIFAWTFQLPVYGITKANATNGGPKAERWYIKPGYGPYQYLLDDGATAGGAVLMGTGVTSLDWLEIFTTGVGFTN